MLSFYTSLKPKIRFGIDFLDMARSRDYLWRDFSTLAGYSSEWVTGFVLFALAQTRQFSTLQLESIKALAALQRPNGGWSYNQDVPTDCDSTCWCYLALSTAPAWRPSAMIRAMGFIKRHQERMTGGFRTYNEKDRIDRYIEVSDPQLVYGWTSPHPSVTAASLQCLFLQGEKPDSDRTQACIQYLLKEEDKNGLWQCYWWKDYAYPTYQSLRALIMGRVKELHFTLTCQTIMNLQNKDGGWSSDNAGDSEVFTTAFNILTLMLFPSEDALASAGRGAAWLLETQKADGGWPSAPILRIPPPMVRQHNNVKKWHLDSLGTGVIIADQRRLFTTAAAIWALSVYSQAIC